VCRREESQGDSHCGAPNPCRSARAEGSVPRPRGSDVSTRTGHVISTRIHLLVDVDNLKIANDTRGHSFGDRIICATARTLGSALGENGVVARIGGDEFGILAPSTDAPAATEPVARIRRAIADHAALDGFPLSASIGYASSATAASAGDTLAAADASMYERKMRAVG
jgi:diguanylate cyclase (GGDEF)-like protein